MADVTMNEQFDWAFPKEWMTELDLEDNESNTTVTYEVVETTKVLEITALLYAGGRIPQELLTPRNYWATALKDAMQSEEGETLTLEETLDGVKYWVEEELNATMQSYAQTKLEGYLDGSEWENYYD
jgi:hypothetical protein